MLALTVTAAEKIKEIHGRDPSLAGKRLRVRVENGGCSRYRYGFAFDDQRPGDAAFRAEGVDLVVDSDSAPLLAGAIVDFREDFSGSGFVLSNPHARQSCGCGKSFDA